ncbi:MAG: CRISPR-associated endonuclease Cas1 [Thermodesulfobacteriota bacterium]|nr:CRISPR-associated endonuclease Cas1 [Thermodesulfobacteriota bacterium]
MVVYVSSQGSKVSKEGRHLLVKSVDGVVRTLFVHKLEQLVLCGNVTLTPQATRLLLYENIDTVFLRTDGRYVGRLSGGESKNIFLRRQQFRRIDDEVFVLKTARTVVEGKLTNQLRVLQRLKRSQKLQHLEKPIAAVKNCIYRLSDTKTLEQVRGMEGAGSSAFFQGYKGAFHQELGFRRRIRRPPTDPVNSVLSLLYTFLINRGYAAVRLAGLDPYPGFLHNLEYGRHSLPLDLIEEFRTILAETLTLSLFNLKVLKADDFYVEEPILPQINEKLDNDIERACHDALGMVSGESAQQQQEVEEELFDLPDQRLGENGGEAGARSGKGAVRLKSDAFKKVITAFEKKLQTEFFHAVAQRRMTYADALVFQARQLRQVIEGEADTYLPLLLK